MCVKGGDRGVGKRGCVRRVRWGEQGWGWVGSMACPATVTHHSLTHSRHPYSLPPSGAPPRHPGRCLPQQRRAHGAGEGASWAVITMMMTLLHPLSLSPHPLTH